MLAVLAVAEEAPIEDLILWAVPESGRSLLRGLRAYAAMIDARHRTSVADEDPGPAGVTELTGFVLTDETAGAIEGIRLADVSLPAAHGRRALLLSRDGLPVDKRLREHLAGAGVEVTVEHGVDWGALMAHPQDALTPIETIAKTIAWLEEAADRAPVAPAPGSDSERESIVFTSDGVALRETALTMPVLGSRLIGMLTEPVDIEPEPVTGVILGAGALAHVGPNRAWVELARRWAARGREDRPDRSGGDRRLRRG